MRTRTISGQYQTRHTFSECETLSSHLDPKRITWGARGRGFKSRRPDHNYSENIEEYGGTPCDRTSGHIIIYPVNSRVIPSLETQGGHKNALASPTVHSGTQGLRGFKAPAVIIHSQARSPVRQGAGA